MCVVRKAPALIAGFVLVAILSVLWPTGGVWGQDTGDGSTDLDIILLIDNSSSMSGGDFVSDPDELRIRAARFLVDYLQANAETLGANYRVGVISFGGEVGDTIPLRLLRDDTLGDHIRPDNIPFTDFREPLQVALQELKAQSFGYGHNMAVILFTDGRPELEDGELVDYFQDDEDDDADLASLVSALEQEGAPLFVLGIGDAQQDRDNWTGLIPEDQYTSINDMAELADVYHNIVANLIGVDVSETEDLPARQQVSVNTPPYLERAVFSFLKSDPGIHVILTAPDGSVETPTLGGTRNVHHEIYSIIAPPQGAWRLLWEGEGTVQYWVDYEYPGARVDLEAPFPYIGRPVTITARVVRRGVVVNAPIRLRAEVNRPGGTTLTIPLASLGDGRHTGILGDVPAPGIYTVTVQGVGDLTVRGETKTVAVLPLPSIPTPEMPTPTVPTPETPTPTIMLTSTPTNTPTSTTETGEATVSPTFTGTTDDSSGNNLWWQIIILMLLMIVIIGSYGMRRLQKQKTLVEDSRNKMRIEKIKTERERDELRERSHPGQIKEKLDEMVSEFRELESVSPDEIQQLWQEFDRYDEPLEGVKAKGFGLLMIITFASGEQDVFKEHLQISVRPDATSSKKRGAAHAVFNLLMRHSKAEVVQCIYEFIDQGCSAEIFKYAAGSEVDDVTSLPGLLKRGSREDEDEIRELCLIYSRLLEPNPDLDGLRKLNTLNDLSRFLYSYGPRDLLALYRSIDDSFNTRRGLGVIPFTIPSELEQAEFKRSDQADSLGQLNELKKILLKFKGKKLYPLVRDEEKTLGFHTELKQAKSEIDGYIKDKGQEQPSPEWYLTRGLVDEWIAFTEPMLPEENAAKLSVEAVTTQLPTNLTSGSLHTAWVLSNQGKSFADIEEIAIMGDQGELFTLSRSYVQRSGEKRLIKFKLKPIDVPALQSGEFKPYLKIRFSDVSKFRIERFDESSPGYRPHQLFEAPTTVKIEQPAHFELIDQEKRERISRETLAGKKRIIYFWGPPGIGKQTLLKELNRLGERSSCLDCTSEISGSSEPHPSARSQEIVANIRERITGDTSVQPDHITLLYSRDIINSLLPIDMEQHRGPTIDVLQGLLDQDETWRLVLVGNQSPQDLARVGIKLPEQTLALALEPLSDDTLIEYVNETDLYRHCNQVDLLTLLGYSGGHQSFANILLDGLVDYLKYAADWKFGQPRYVHGRLVSRVIKYMVRPDEQRPGPSLITSAWNEFSGDEQAVIEALCKSMRQSGDESASLTEIMFYSELRERRQVGQIIERLCDYRILNERYGQYELRVGIIAGWLSMQEGEEFVLPRSATMEIVE